MIEFTQNNISFPVKLYEKALSYESKYFGAANGIRICQSRGDTNFLNDLKLYNLDLNNFITNQQIQEQMWTAAERIIHMAEREDRFVRYLIRSNYY